MKNEVFWETRFDELACYNSDVAHGLVHTPEHKKCMVELQNEYNSKLRRMFPEDRIECGEPLGKDRTDNNIGGQP